MTEADWLACTDPDWMLVFLRGRASERKLRLFACACVRRVWHLIADARSRAAVEFSERFAEGLVGWEEQLLAFVAAQDARGAFAWPARLTLWADAHGVAVGAAATLGREGKAVPPETLCALLRDFFCPFRPVAVDGAWRSWNGGAVARLAQAAYEERHLPAGLLDSARLAVMADALEEAGCGDADLLGHLRSGGEHVRGCHVLDALLGKT
jgi:hypothetical protein